MNILPKKRWHVRTKDNIAKVRRDEAAAKEEERLKQEKLKLAESEARINFLRRQSGLPERQSGPEANEQDAAANDGGANSQHVDLFADYKTHIKITNKDLEEEKKAEQEKYEKQIGYLTYLGQDTNEALKLKSWYELAPSRALVGESNVTEKDLKTKVSHDPLTLMKALLPTEAKPPSSASKSKRSKTPEFHIESAEAKPKKIHRHKKHSKERKKHKKDKHKKRYKHSNRSSQRDRVADETEKLGKCAKLEQLRKERLQREAVERSRQEALLSSKSETAPVPPKPADVATPRIVQKYNSQFNPELAKQNMN